MPIMLLDIPTISEGDEDIASIDGTVWLDGIELFTGTPTVVELGIITGYDANDDPIITTTTDLTLGNKSINSLPITIKNKSVGSGRAIQFSIKGQKAGFVYALQVTCSTDSSPARKKTFIARTKVK